MKNLKILFYFVVITTTVAFASCERISDNKETVNNLNAKFEKTGDPYDYAFINPQWELVDENYKDEYGNTGKLYANANNELEQLLKIEERAKICADYKGVWTTVEVYDENTRTTTYYQSCQQTASNANCGITLCVDDKTKKITVAIYPLK